MESTLFPIGMEKHIIFCIVAAIFFVFQFLRTKQWYQLVMAAAIPLSLLIYIDGENTALFYGVGILETVLLIGAMGLSIWQSQKEHKAEKTAEAEKKTADEAKKAAAEEAEEKAEDAAEDAAENTENADAEPAEESADPTEDAAASQEE